MMLTARDREEIRIGRNRAIGARYAMLLFWGPFWGWVVVTLAVIAALVFVGFWAHDVWVGGLDRAVEGYWAWVAFGLALLALAVRLAFPPRRRRRRRRRW
jgi:hypothetical protein